MLNVAEFNHWQMELVDEWCGWAEDFNPLIFSINSCIHLTLWIKDHRKNLFRDSISYKLTMCGSYKNFIDGQHGLVVQMVQWYTWLSGPYHMDHTVCLDHLSLSDCVWVHEGLISLDICPVVCRWIILLSKTTCLRLVFFPFEYFHPLRDLGGLYIRTRFDFRAILSASI